MSDLLTHIERSELVDVDLNKEPQCEGRAHGTRKYGHDDGPAKFNVVFRCPCGVFPVLACAGRVTYWRNIGAVCEECGFQFSPADIRFIEL